MDFAKIKNQTIVDVIVLSSDRVDDVDYIQTFSGGCDMLVSLDGLDPKPRIGDQYVDHKFIFIEPELPDDAA